MNERIWGCWNRKMDSKPSSFHIYSTAKFERYNWPCRPYPMFENKSCNWLLRRCQSIEVLRPRISSFIFLGPWQFQVNAWLVDRHRQHWKCLWCYVTQNLQLVWRITWETFWLAPLAPHLFLYDLHETDTRILASLISFHLRIYCCAPWLAKMHPWKNAKSHMKRSS